MKIEIIVNRCFSRVLPKLPIARATTKLALLDLAPDDADDDDNDVNDELVLVLVLINLIAGSLG